MIMHTLKNKYNDNKHVNVNDNEIDNDNDNGNYNISHVPAAAVHPLSKLASFSVARVALDSLLLAAISAGATVVCVPRRGRVSRGEKEKMAAWTDVGSAGSTTAWL